MCAIFVGQALLKYFGVPSWSRCSNLVQLFISGSKKGKIYTSLSLSFSYFSRTDVLCGDLACRFTKAYPALILNFLACY